MIVWREGYKLDCSNKIPAAQVGDFPGNTLDEVATYMQQHSYNVQKTNGIWYYTFQTPTCTPTCRIFINEHEARQAHG